MDLKHIVLCLTVTFSMIPPGAHPLPGPKGYPIVGRVHDVPTKASWLKFYDWSKEYGPIYQTEMFGTVHVWISSERVAHDLLSRRAAIYSDRPQIPNLPDNRTKGEYLALTGRNGMFSFQFLEEYYLLMMSTDTWKRQRKLAQQLMAANASLHDYPTKERDRFLYLFSTDPSQYREFIEQFTSRTVARLTWGSPHSAERLRVTTAGLLPLEARGDARHEMEAELLKDNVKYAHDRIEDGTVQPSFIRTFIESSDLPGGKPECIEETEASYVIGQMAIAGALTIGSPIQSFLLAMLHYPEWQKKLQDEIDSVCDGACPQWEDREKLPMLRAVVKEVIRWRPPVPTGIPHAIEKDDVYDGYFIPAGATVHALEWAMTRDEKTYPNADAFNPARWLEPEYPTYKEPLTVHPKLNGFSQFGFGRRTCQGIPLVEQDLYLAMGGLAWAFNIRKKRRGDGSEVPVHWNDYTPLLIAKPVLFEFDAVVRSEEKKGLLRRMWESGKGDDDREQEDKLLRQELHRNMCGDGDDTEKKEIGVDSPVVDDASSDRGSDTSGPTHSTTESVFSLGQSDSDACDMEHISLLR
ncbi:hypothetical protein EKO27_g8620 [Xylaria grammica]|uniref:Cytochrome P450 n=1 Tax=Xylaria grammica TaxID=363999 RepID=A0A439CWJ2_9PEZI|nr:hypothetical protein EKO27_g8620 [Xylaria grammica]